MLHKYNTCLRLVILAFRCQIQILLLTYLLTYLHVTQEVYLEVFSAFGKVFAQVTNDIIQLAAHK